MSRRDHLDRAQVCRRLGITLLQLHQLRKNPAFPKPQGEGFAVVWEASEIARFRKVLEHGRQRGWKVPEALYAWKVDFPEDWRWRRERLQQVRRRDPDNE
jgi:hypothetical protein